MVRFNVSVKGTVVLSNFWSKLDDLLSRVSTAML